MKNIYEFDSKGHSFEFPSCVLEAKEYAKIISEINTNYSKYANDELGIHYSYGIDNNVYRYYFENRGYNDYNIVSKQLVK